jgi:hypothetical protein
MVRVSEQPSRYTRSFSGMTGALVVTVVVVLAFVVWRSLFRGDTDDTPVPVDWQASVQLAEDAGYPVVHPLELPAGWTATSADLVAVGDKTWGLGVLTADGKFVGIRQEDATQEDLAQTYVDEKADPGEDASIDSDVTDTWGTWSDSGGDHGYSADVGDQAVLVYGSAPVADIETFVGLLTD